MSSHQFKHNRKRNSSIVHELLMRHLAKQTIEKNKTEWTKTYNIIAKYYSPGSVLAEELKHFDVLRNNRGLKEITARKILNEVLSSVKKLDNKMVDIKKSNLIKDVNYTFGQDFFGKYRLSEYRLLASIQMLFDNSRMPNKLNESVNKIQLEESLINFMTSNHEDKKIILNNEIDSTVLDSVENKYKDKYKTLNEHQKKLLSTYVFATLKNQPKILNETIQAEKVRVLTELKSCRTMKEIVEDKVMQERFDESIKKLQNMKEGNLSQEKIVEELLLYSKLVEELKSNE